MKQISLLVLIMGVIFLAHYCDAQNNVHNRPPPPPRDQRFKREEEFDFKKDAAFEKAVKMEEQMLGCDCANMKCDTASMASKPDKCQFICCIKKRHQDGHFAGEHNMRNRFQRMQERDP